MTGRVIACHLARPWAPLLPSSLRWAPAEPSSGLLKRRGEMFYTHDPHVSAVRQ